MNWWAVMALAVLPLLFVPMHRGKVGRRPSIPLDERVEPCGGVPRSAAQRLSFWLIEFARKRGVQL